MADPEIVLEWWRDASGYDLLEPTSDQGERIEALFKAKPELSDRATVVIFLFGVCGILHLGSMLQYVPRF
jgi:hypothetical protein